MATYYVDPRVAGPGAGTQNDPYKLVSSITIATGDTVYLASGTTLTETVTIPAGADNVTIDVYGGTARATIDAEYTRNYGLTGGSISGFTLRNVDAINALRNGVYIYNDVASTTETNITLRNVEVRDIGPAIASPSTETDIEKGIGVLVRSGPTSGTAVLDGVVMDNVTAHRCGKHGVDLRWRVLNATGRNVRTYRCGLTGGGHGITLHPIASTHTSGWTLVSGNVYSRAFASGSDNPQRMINNTAATILDAAGTTTTPSTGQWSRSGTTLYVNLGGTDPNTVSIAVKRHAHGPFVFEDSEGSFCPMFNGTEGYGICADDLSGPATFRRCLARGNGGRGFFSFRGESLVFQSCIAQFNGFGGIQLDRVTGGQIDNCWAHRNENRGIAFLNDARTSTLRNSISTYNALGASDSALTGGGIFMAPGGVATFTQATNIEYGNGGSTVLNNASATTALPIAVSLEDVTRGMAKGSPTIRAGTFVAAGVLDFRGVPFTVPVDVGPFATNTRVGGE